jgi:hypothetical protein
MYDRLATAVIEVEVVATRVTLVTVGVGIPPSVIDTSPETLTGSGNVRVSPPLSFTRIAGVSGAATAPAKHTAQMNTSERARMVLVMVSLLS